ncbi:hypothetical protein N7471_000169 [Penicillium samsonianum]|uniref:uncharacterized protein n=1 Tax=Penicillium samsonianum TaxID=1882272 RepID=UPI002548E7E0|nr:uncharacterized protein N7471_000169 [Penicillium samsonianum]KAJ6148970.1 hypothetical protein N7471_000169 [Penicillium samsonianum]
MFIFHHILPGKKRSQEEEPAVEDASSRKHQRHVQFQGIRQQFQIYRDPNYVKVRGKCLVCFNRPTGLDEDLQPNPDGMQFSLTVPIAEAKQDPGGLVD